VCGQPSSEVGSGHLGESGQFVDGHDVLGSGKGDAELPFDVSQLLGKGGSAVGEFADLLRRGGPFRAPCGIRLLDTALDLIAGDHGDLLSIGDCVSAVECHRIHEPSAGDDLRSMGPGRRCRLSGVCVARGCRRHWGATGGDRRCRTDRSASQRYWLDSVWSSSLSCRAGRVVGLKRCRAGIVVSTWVLVVWFVVGAMGQAVSQFAGLRGGCLVDLGESGGEQR
jgi:hypothetical protein